MRGFWGAAQIPFLEDGSFNEEGLRKNIRHWVDDLDNQGLINAGKQWEFFSILLDERKHNFEIAVEECDGKAATITSASYQNFDIVVELEKCAQNCGTDYVVVHAPNPAFRHR